MYGATPEAAQVDENPNKTHLIDQRNAMDYCSQKDYVLNKEDFVQLLLADGAIFDPTSLRIYYDDEQVFYQITDQFELEMDPEVGHTEILLWIRPPAPRDNTERIEKMSAIIEDLQKQLADVKAVMQELNLAQQLGKNPSIQNEEEANRHSNNTAETLQVPSLYSKIFNHSFYDLKSANHLERNPSLIHTKSSAATFTAADTSPQRFLKEDFDPFSGSYEREVDMAILYSEPLVRSTENSIEPLCDPVDFEEECNKLLEILSEKKKRIDLIFELARHEKLVNILSKGPIILHIICHGDYSKERKQFYLCFEQENGRLLEFYSDDLKAILEKVETRIQLVFVNACHSEEVARVFENAGIPCVIAIQSELRIADTVAQKFSQFFYNKLFDGKSIGAAFEIAKVAAKSSDLHTCCCAHSHKDDCPWYNQLALSQGYYHAHNHHTPTCLDCKRRNEHIHKGTCEWAQNFSFDYKLDPFDAPQGVSDNEIWTCCCSPELPHNELLKFKKICSSESVDQMILFPHKEIGNVVNVNPYSVIEQKFSVKRLSGRNKELYQLYEILTSQEHKFVQLNGKEGVGKTSLVKQVANYLYERGYFRDKICIIIMDKTPSIGHFMSDLYKEFPGTYDMKTFCEEIKSKKILFILERCDVLVEKHKIEFKSRLKEISDAAKYVKFIIIKNEYERLLLNEPVVMLTGLEAIDAAKILLKYAFTYLSIDKRNINTLSSMPLFQQKLIPQRIWYISERLKNVSLEYIQDEILTTQNQNQQKEQENDQAVGATLQ